MRARSAGRSLGAGGRRMADAVLFEFLHTEMVAELWAHDPDSGPGGQNMSLSVLEGMGFRVGQALGESLARRPPSIGLAQVSAAAPQAVPGDAGLQGGAGHPQVPVQRPVDGRVPEADGQPPHQPPGFSSAQGTYVLQDNSFPLLIRMASGLQYLEEAPKVSSRW
ncbi:trafficking protein particle complex subunit 6A isoform X12 [Equus przewalskii]|uniref:Trafficking protein particle complex subunit 6A isoform X12 n=1 Tax=Equus przewalskii TaxID=9798 RepID=A0ABM4QHY3_EQUPR